MFYFGVDYYPEQWPEERWKIDAQMMSEAGFNVVRLAEFAWSKLEPVEGQYDFDWLDGAISTLSEHGIQVILGTPTASPPPWLMGKSPDFFLVREDGTRATYGNRREYCPNHADFQTYCQRIVKQMAEHYGNHPAVIGWQIDNELGERCYCPICAGKFQTWLRSRYEALDDLNQNWGTIFWSHQYNDWSEIPIPLKSGGSPNPGLALDYYRFCSDSYISFQKAQIDIIKELSQNRLVTHNLMGFKYDKLNYFDFVRELDLVGYDNYPRSQWSFSDTVDPSELALSFATMRGLKQKNFWVLEQQAGSGGWEMISVPPRPGELRLWAYQAIAHGADAILFFRWRTARYGTEQYWHGLLDHDAHACRRYQEIKQLGQEIKISGQQIAGSRVKSRVALLLSYDSRFAFQIQPNHPCFSYDEHFHQVYRSFYRRNISIDVLSPSADLAAYKLVVAPSLHLITEAQASNLTRYVSQGGVLVVTQRSGVKDETNAVVNQRLPGLLAEVCGVEVEEYDSLHPNMRNSIKLISPEFAGQSEYDVGVLCDILRPTTSSTVACYQHDFYAGKPAITHNRYGKGQAVYIGAMGNGQLYGALAGWLMVIAGITPGAAAPEGIEICERWQGDKRLLFVLNHHTEPLEMTLEHRYSDLISGKEFEGDIRIPPREVLILSEGV